jgi:glycosyltransferase involved in cell wall biosynthesis
MTSSLTRTEHVAVDAPVLHRAQQLLGAAGGLVVVQPAPDDATAVVVSSADDAAEGARSDDRRVATAEDLVAALGAVGPEGAVLLTGVLDVPGLVWALDAAATAHADHGFALALDVANAATSRSAAALVVGRIDGDPLVPRFSSGSLDRWLAARGLSVVGRETVPSEPRVERGTALVELVDRVRSGADGHADVERLLRTLTTAHSVAAPAESPETTAPGPFLSIVTRTQGRRLECLREALTSLLAQTDGDFELLVMAHRVDDTQEAAIREVIDEQPAFIRSRARLLRSERAGRSAPLNDGFEQARGRYVVILDDDDIPLPHWVQTFHELESEAPGRLLRTMCVLQDVEPVEVGGDGAVRAVSGPRAQHPPVFDLVQHLEGNYTPNTAVAFPRDAYAVHGLRFDEALGTAEDWEFMMRAATIVGVQSRAEITCVYHWWTAAESSRTAHSQDEWQKNLDTILGRFDALPMVLGPGSAKRIRDIQLERYHVGLEVAAAHDALRALEHELGTRNGLLREIDDLLRSRSWRMTAPLRALSTLAGRGRPVRAVDYVGLSADDLRAVLAALRASRSWRVGQRVARLTRRGAA